jgi:hypothetical protein
LALWKGAIRVNNEDDALSTLKVVPPQRTDVGLIPEVPHEELQIPDMSGLHGESNTRNLRDTLALLEALWNRGLPVGPMPSIRIPYSGSEVRLRLAVGTQKEGY